MTKHECVKCGYCCRVRPCPYGDWNEEGDACMHLTEDSLCAIYDKLKHYKLSPAMGTECSSPLFNRVRDRKIRELRKNVSQSK